MSPMERKEQYHMTKKEIARLKVAERLIERAMRVEEASHILNISTRQVIRIKGRVKEIGPEAVNLSSLNIEFLLNIFFDQDIYYLGKDPECRTRVKAPFKRSVYRYAIGR
jgi:hypothetical protein